MFISYADFSPWCIAGNWPFSSDRLLYLESRELTHIAKIISFYQIPLTSGMPEPHAYGANALTSNTANDAMDTAHNT